MPNFGTGKKEEKNMKRKSVTVEREDRWRQVPHDKIERS